MVNNWSRRKFVEAVAGTSAMLVVGPLISWSKYLDTLDPRVAKIVAGTVGIDTHNHVDVPLVKDGVTAPKIDLAGDLTKSGLSAIVVNFAVDYVKLTYEGQAYERFLTGIGEMDELLKYNNVYRAYSSKDIEDAHAEKRSVVIQALEGGHFLEGKIERLQVAYDRGLRHLGILHDNDANVPLGDVFTNPPKWGGLTKFGAEVIKECERLGILVDLAHCDDNTVNMALKIAQNPVIITHTGLNSRLGRDEKMGKMMYKRLISEEQAKIIAGSGGVIGVWTHLSNTASEYAENIRAMVDVVGIDHVAIGTDTKLTMPYHANENNGEKSHDDRVDKKGPPNSGTQKHFFGERTNQAWENQREGFYYAVVDALLKVGFSETEIAKIGGDNYLRVFKIAVGK